MVQASTFRPHAIALAFTALLCAGGAQAATLRWAGANDIMTLDPHAQNHQTTHTFLQQVYEPLVRYGKDFQIEPALATKWTQITPTQWRFELRKGVKFHDGAPFTADDVVFSLTRIMTPPSNMMTSTQSIQEVKKIDDYTVDLILKGPSPILLREISESRIMNKAWAEKNNAVKSQNYAAKEDVFSNRNTNGTGAYITVSWQPDVKLTLKKNPDWWDKPTGNVDEVVFTPLKSAAARTAALISGQVDFMIDPPPQDQERIKKTPELKLLEGTENRTIFLGLDLFRDELPGAGTPGKNPLKDARVRKALYMAIDSDGLHKRTMRGMSIPAGTMVAPMVHGWTKELEARAAPYDPEAAKKLLAEAGYPSGFSLKLECPNDRYVNDEAICQAVTAMWTRAGVKTTLQTMPMSQFSPRIQTAEPSAYLYGWGVATFDTLYTLNSLIHSKGAAGAGSNNGGRIADKALDAKIDAAKVEPDQAKRDALLNDALSITKNEFYTLPLHHQVYPWAMRKGIDTVYRADARPIPAWTTIK